MIAGYRLTARDVVTSLKATGDVASARVLTDETSGTVQTYEFSYKVHAGKIMWGHSVLLATSYPRPKALSELTHAISAQSNDLVRVMRSVLGPSTDWRQGQHGRGRQLGRAAIDAVTVGWKIGSGEDSPCCTWSVPIQCRSSHLYPHACQWRAWLREAAGCACPVHPDAPVFCLPDRYRANAERV